MASKRKVRGGVVLSENPDAQGVIELLTHQVRDRLDLLYYLHPYDISLDEVHDCIMVLSLEDLKQVIRFYDGKRRPLPLLIHINDPDLLFATNHATLFPGVNIALVPQASLGAAPDVTLELTRFKRIIERLSTQLGH